MTNYLKCAVCVLNTNKHKPTYVTQYFEHLHLILHKHRLYI